MYLMLTVHVHVIMHVVLLCIIICAGKDKDLSDVTAVLSTNSRSSRGRKLPLKVLKQWKEGIQVSHTHTVVTQVEYALQYYATLSIIIFTIATMYMYMYMYNLC